MWQSLSCSVKAGRWCLGCPGWPPGLRFFRFFAAGGRTKSLDGGFDELVEFFSSLANRDSNSVIRCRKTAHWGQS